MVRESSSSGLIQRTSEDSSLVVGSARVDLDGRPDDDEPIPPSIEVGHSVREGGDTKTRKSRRTLAIPIRGVVALRAQRSLQDQDREKAGNDWRALDLVFASSIGTALDAANVRRAFRRITKSAGPQPGRLDALGSCATASCHCCRTAVSHPTTSPTCARTPAPRSPKRCTAISFGPSC